MSDDETTPLVAPAAGPNGLAMSPQIADLATALAKAQGEIKAAAKDRTNPFFKSKYATLDAVWDACRPALSSNGLSVVQTLTTPHEGTVGITTLLLHASGQWIKSELILGADDGSPQAVGSASTYGRRYGLSAIVGVTAEEDDDGEAAQNASGAPRRDFSKGPTHGPAAITAGDPKPAPTPEQEAATAKEARGLFQTTDDQAERAQYIKELKRLKTALKMTDTETLTISVTYLGKGVPTATADLPDLASLVDFLRQKNGEPKFRAEGEASK